MNIIERTQYSADGGKTWSDTEREAMAERVHQNLMEVMSIGEADDVLSVIENTPDALITALRDMGALPEESGEPSDWANGSWARAADAVERGELQHGGQRYAVVPIEEYQRATAALEAIKAVARGDGPIFSASDWCDANHINWRDD